MKFGLSRGGASERENRQSRESGLRDIERSGKAKKRAAVKQLREALRAATREARAGCQQWRTDAHLRAAEGRREFLYDLNQQREKTREGYRQVKFTLAEELAALKTACASRIATAVAPIRASIEELASELRTSALARRHSAERAREKPKASAKETREEQIEAALRDVETLDPALVPLLKKEGRTIAPKPRQTMGEAYLEWIAENPERVREYQAKLSLVGQADMMCGQAINDAKMGSPEAQAWAAKHCTEEGAATPSFRRKTSAASRTINLFGGDSKTPPEVPKEARIPALAGILFFARDGRMYAKREGTGEKPIVVGEFGRNLKTDTYSAMAHDNASVSEGPRREGLRGRVEAESWIVGQIAASPFWREWLKPRAAPKKKGAKGQGGLSAGPLGADFLDAVPF